jgi:hypothetical protein
VIEVTRTRDGTVACGGCGHTFTPTTTEPEPPTESPPVPAPQAPRQFPVIPFTPPRGGPPIGLGLAAFAGLIAALVFAVLAALLRSHLWLVIVFPMLHGIFVGVFAGLGARVAKARYRTGVGVVGAACGLVSYAGVHYLHYLSFAAAPNAPRVGFWEFMDVRATEGVKIGKAGGAGNGIGYTGSVIYWSLEAVITMIGAAGVAVVTIGKPFCEGCNRWKSKHQLGPYLVEPGYAVPAVGAGVPTGLLVPADGKKSVVVEVYSCPVCGDEGTLDVKVTGTHQDGKTMRSWNGYVTYPGEALHVFNEVERACRELGLKLKKGSR